MSWQIKVRNGGVDVNQEMNDDLYDIIFSTAAGNLYDEWLTIPDEAVALIRTANTKGI